MGESERTADTEGDVEKSEVGESASEVAESTEETAESTSETAESTSETAESTSETAESTSETAESTSETAESTSETAESTSETAESTSTPTNQPPSLGSRILITWAGLTAVTVIGGFLSAALSGPVGFIVYLATSLAVVAVLLYNVNELVKDWIAAIRAESTGD